MAQESDDYLRQLQAQYPIGNYEDWPHSHVLKQVVGGRAMY